MCYVIPKFSLVFVERFVSMHVTLSPDLLVVHLPLTITRTMASKRAGPKETDGSVAGRVVAQVSARLLIYEDTKLILYKDIKLKWQEVNDAFAGTYREDLEDLQVYMNIHKYGLYWIACPRVPMHVHDTLDRLAH